MATVTVVGANSDVFTISLDGTTNLLLAQQFASLVNGAAAAGTLSASILSPASTIAALAQGTVGLAQVVTPLASYAYPAGYAALLDVATGPTTISSALSVTPVRILSAGGGATVLAGPAQTQFISGGGANTFTGYSAPGGLTAVLDAATNLNMVATGAGDDTITTGTGNYDIDPGEGRNIVTLGSGTSFVNSIGQDLITGGASIAGAVAVSTIFLTGAGATVVGGSAALAILDRTTSGPAGGGADVVTLGSGGGSITGVAFSTFNLAGTASVTAGGSDTINVGGANATVNADTTGGGATLVNGPTGTGSLLFIGGTGVSSIVGGSLAVTVAGASGGSVTFQGAASGNLFRVATAADVNASMMDASAGTGANTFVMGTGSATTAASTVLGGTGADLFMLGKAASSLTGGASGVNTYEFVATATGGARDVITDFKPADRLSISGYLVNGANLLGTSSVATSGSTTTLTLSDQTTIVLQNVTTLSGTNFN